jgi:hypothetical protein
LVLRNSFSSPTPTPATNLIAYEGKQFMPETTQSLEPATDNKPSVLLGSQPESEAMDENRLPIERATFDEFEELKAKAVKADELQATHQRTMRMHVDRVVELEKELTTLQTQILRHRVAESKGVPAHLLTGSTEEEYVSAAEALLTFKNTQTGPIVPADGTASTNSGTGCDWLRRELTNK